jgi:hypothetical protein
VEPSWTSWWGHSSVVDSLGVGSSVTGRMRSPELVTVRGPFEVTLVTLSSECRQPLLCCVAWIRWCTS